MPGRVQITEDGPNVTISLAGNNGDITAGGNGEDGQLILKDAAGAEILRLSIIKNDKGNSICDIRFKSVLQFNQGNQKTLQIGTATLEIFEPISGKPTIDLDAAPAGATITIGGNAKAGTLKVLTKMDEVGTQISGSSVSASSFQAQGQTGRTSIDGGSLKLVKEGKQFATLEDGRFRLGSTDLGGNLMIASENGDGILLGENPPIVKIGNLGDGSLSLSQETVFLSNRHGIVFQLLPNGIIRAGGSESSGELALRDENNKERIILSAGIPKLSLKTADDQTVFYVDSRGDLELGGSGNDGDIFLKSSSGTHRVHLGADEGRINLISEAGQTGFSVNGEGQLTLMSGSVGSRVALKQSAGETTAVLGSNGELLLGGNGVAGDVRLKRPDGKQTAVLSSAGDLLLGGDGVSGDVRLKQPDGKQTAVLSSAGDLLLGGDGEDGHLRLYPKDVRNGSSEDWTIHLDAQAGDIILRNADCAEEFDIAAGEQVEAGTVVVIDEEGRLRRSEKAYDKRVAGVISGAGAYRPGIVLDKQPLSKERRPVALMGKVYCNVDAGYGAIGVGDLLTTSPTSGFAMKAIDPFKAFGAVIGKALRPLREGQGLIPILIALQ